MKDVKELVNKAIENITAAKWRKCEEHSIKVEEEFWKLDFGSRKPIEKLIINLDEEDSDSESDSDDDEDDE